MCRSCQHCSEKSPAALGTWTEGGDREQQDQPVFFAEYRK
ncbi:unnamed protein product [Staurois parvus]|uniref:Uncharacterized protein n=1 Tax=Staurois parvus TaxID=386267 RepID=A0ABN9C9M0_9NEOB|nr:unnamed protein product [Staurois parvus]